MNSSDPLTAAASLSSVQGDPAPVLEVTRLTVELRTARGDLTAVQGVSFSARVGQTVVLLGESGCGKSMTAKAISNLLDPIATVTAGSINVEGVDVLKLKARARRKLSGPKLGLVTQDALTALNPVYPVGQQIAEPFRIHTKLSRAEAHRRAVQLMERVGIPEAASRAKDYPHQFSGGMRQRALIAMAVALKPRVLIADEPTTALDVTVQAQIMELLEELRREHEMAVVLITHDLAVAAEEADTVVVMYAGLVIESGPVDEVFRSPHHPYTKGLLESVPAGQARGADLNSIPGSPPELASIPTGCVFQDRCPRVQQKCRDERPTLLSHGHAGRSAACHFPEGVQ